MAKIRTTRKSLLLLTSILSILAYLFMFRTLIPGRRHVKGESILRFENPSGDRLPKPGRLLILTYFRSGSSFTGDILQQSPDVFYLFEPLRFLQEYMDAGHREVLLQNKSKRLMESKSSEYYNNLLSWYSCNTEKIDMQSLHSVVMKESLSTKSYWGCIGGMTRNKQPRDEFFACLHDLKTRCQTSKSKHVKSIRVSMKMAVQLLSDYEDLKILHLLRDPRGMFRSRIHRYETRARNLENNVLVNEITMFSQRALDDVVESERWHEIFPGRIRRVYYEDIATRPVELSEKLFQYAGLEFTEKAKEYIANITASRTPMKAQCDFCTFRGNSTATAVKWRTEGSIGDIKLVDDACSKLYEKLGYVKFGDSRDLLNMSIPNRRPIYSDLNVVNL